MTIKNKINLSIASFAIFALTFLFLAVWPLFGEIKGNSQKLILQREKAVNENAQNERLEQFKAFSVVFAANFKKIEDLFINSEVPVEFIRFLEETAKSERLQITIVSLSPAAAEKDEWPSLAFQVSANGSFSDLMKFLEKIENSFYLIEVRSLNVAAGGAGVSGSGSAEASFSIEVFTK